ncbi:phosphodiesterase [Halolamina pelagica]|uniref:Phosphoesterase n=1 Tax=Halolamina pelagica TaxID=699431 RepID=A0A0P7H782_9EURY|nr:metallophosphoesterase family protein [Halolamina pelagica]KPN29216.1 phosphodiesterase [Halolamina pelagica]
MRVALLSDIHANEPALQAVLSDLPSEQVDSVICVGDIVGYGPDPKACVSLVRAHADHCVAGNHDREANTPDRYSGHPTAGPGLQHTYDQLGDDERTWLTELPERRKLPDHSITVAHSHPDPAHTDRYVYPDEFSTVGAPVDTDLLAMGHTHVQGAETVDGTLVVNPGSVGQPRDGEPGAAYAIVDIDDQTADLRRVDYDIDAVRNRVRAAGLPDETWERLEEGR